MSRRDYRTVGVYLPVIKGSIDIQDIVAELALAATNALKKLRKSALIDMYYTHVSKDGFDNDLFDKLVQLVADSVDASEAWDDIDYIEDSAELIVLGTASEFVLSNSSLSRLLTNEELDLAEECAAVLDDHIRQLERPARRSSRGGRDRRDAYDDRGSRDRGRSRRDTDRSAYNGGRSEYEPAPRSRSRRDNRVASRSRGNFDYRGNERDTRGSSSRNGRQPPTDDYNDDIDYGRDTGRMTAKERLRRETDSPRTRQDDTRRDNRRADPVRDNREQPVQDGRRDPTKPRYEVESPKPRKPQHPEEIMYEQEDGRQVLIVPATKPNMRVRKSPYNVVPLFPTTVDGYFTLNSSGDITGVLGLPKAEEDMERQKHDITRFFKTWGNKNNSVDHRATAKALGDIQSKALISQMEKELEAKYGLDNAESLPDIDVDKLYVAKNLTTYETHEDFVSTGKSLLLDDVEHENLRTKFEEVLSDIPINYSAIQFYGFSITGEAAKKALELKGLVSFNGIKNKLIELEPLVPSSVLHELDTIATDWVNNLVRHKFGILNWDIDSFLSDIEELITELAKDHGITVAFTSQASGMVETVLRPLSNKDADVRALTGLTEDGDLTVKFGKLSNITLLQIDSDEIALFLKEECGSVTHDSWSSMAMALDVVNTLSKPNTAEMLLVTRDNRKIYVDNGSMKGEYVLSR